MNMQILKPALVALAVAFGSTAHATAPELILSQSFSLSQAHSYLWTKEKPEITEGTIVVVGVESEDAQVRQVGGPVLYVGPVPAERVNNGDMDGAIIAFVPGHIDLSKTPIYWGPPTLPERVDEKAGAAALRSTRVAPHSKATIDALRKPAAQLNDTADLYRHLANLIDTHAPSERERAQGYRGGLR